MDTIQKSKCPFSSKSHWFIHSEKNLIWICQIEQQQQHTTKEPCWFLDLKSKVWKSSVECARFPRKITLNKPNFGSFLHWLLYILLWTSVLFNLLTHQKSSASIEMKLQNNVRDECVCSPTKQTYHSVNILSFFAYETPKTTFKLKLELKHRKYTYSKDIDFWLLVAYMRKRHWNKEIKCKNEMEENVKLIDFLVSSIHWDDTCSCVEKKNKRCKFIYTQLKLLLLPALLVQFYFYSQQFNSPLTK